MGYIWYNNWPYSYTYCPSMTENEDVVHEQYFSGIHTEILRIEQFLGLHPQGAFNSVKERLDNINSQVSGMTLEQVRANGNGVSGNIDLNKNKIIDLVLDDTNVDTDFNVKGMIRCHPSDGRLCWYNGTEITTLRRLIFNIDGFNFAVPDSGGASKTKITVNNNTYYAVEFLNSVDSYASINRPLPPTYGPTNYTFYLLYKANATSGEAKLDMRIYHLKKDAQFSVSGAATITETFQLEVGDVVYDLCVMQYGFTLTGVSEGDYLLFSFMRDGDAAEDTLTVTLQVMGAYLIEQKSIFGA